MRRAAARAGLAALALVCALAGPALALEARIRGTLLNGTTGEAGRADFVRLLRLGQGMEAVGGAERVDGSFEIEFTAEPGDALLLQANAGGVNYSESIELDPSGRHDVAITVYDTTSSWDGVRVRSYRVGLAAEGEMLRVFKVVDLEVSGPSPRTVVGEPGAFRFYTQPDLLHIGSVTAQSGALPLTIDPIPLEGEREFAVGYPLRPGITEMQVQYDLTYDEIGTVFSEALIYPVDQMQVLVVPMTLEITSELLADHGVDEENGLRLFMGTDLPEGAPVVLRLAGSGAEAPRREGGGEGPVGSIVRVPNRTQDLLVPTVFGVLGTLLFTVGFMLTRKPVRTTSARGRADPALLERREAILARIVALDRRHREGQISEYAYWQKREALKAGLVEIMRHVDRGPGRSSDD